MAYMVFSCAFNVDMQVGPVQHLYVGMQQLTNGNMEALLHSIRPEGQVNDSNHINSSTDAMIDEMTTRIQGKQHFWDPENEENSCRESFEDTVRCSWRLTKALSEPQDSMDQNIKLRALLQQIDNSAVPQGNQHGEFGQQRRRTMLHSRTDLLCKHTRLQDVAGNVALALRCFLSWKWTLQTMHRMAKAVAALHGEILSVCCHADTECLRFSLLMCSDGCGADHEVAHCDIKLANFVLDSPDDVRVVDFGRSCLQVRLLNT